MVGLIDFMLNYPNPGEFELNLIKAGWDQLNYMEKQTVFDHITHIGIIHKHGWFVGVNHSYLYHRLGEGYINLYLH